MEEESNNGVFSELHIYCTSCRAPTLTEKSKGAMVHHCVWPHHKIKIGCTVYPQIQNTALAFPHSKYTTELGKVAGGRPPIFTARWDGSSIVLPKTIGGLLRPISREKKVSSVSPENQRRRGRTCPKLEMRPVARGFPRLPFPLAFFRAQRKGRQDIGGSRVSVLGRDGFLSLDLIRR